MCGRYTSAVPKAMLRERFVLESGEPFAFAGLWTIWRDPERDEEIVSCTIVTTRPNELVGLVHDRMPVILPREFETAWLSPSVAAADALAVLEPYPAELM